MIPKAKREHLFALTPKQKEVANYLIKQDSINFKKWAEELNLTLNNLHTHLYVLRDKFYVSSNTELLEQIKLNGTELS